MIYYQKKEIQKSQESLLEMIKNIINALMFLYLDYKEQNKN